jgi:predicted nucleic acid-binding protein
MSKNYRLVYTQYNKVLSWVLSFGAEARPVAPALLVKEWKEHITALYKSVKRYRR